ncbi:Ran-binding protein M homolog [Linum perenne]
MTNSASKTTATSTNYSSNNGNATCSNSGNPSSHQEDPASYFLALASGGGFVEEDREEAPTELNTINSSGGFVVVSTDKLSVKYKNVNLHGNDVGAVQANRPAPVKRLMYYFEMTVRNGGAKGQIAIGFTHEKFKMRRQPGSGIYLFRIYRWEANSCGYHGDDGHLYHGQGKGLPFGPTFTTKDIVGAGINYGSQEFFFTKNGALVGTVKKEINEALFPTVAVHSQNEEYVVPFPIFLFNVLLCEQDYERQERMRQHLVIDKISLPKNISHGLVRSYLLHYGYKETLNSFDLACKNTVPPILISEENGYDSQDIVYALNQRRELRQLIRNGQIDAATSKLRDWFPQILEDENSATCFLLHCQKFIELVRIGELEEAVKYGRIQLANFFSMPVYNDLVQDCVTLLAYDEPQRSPVSYLLEDARRELVADTVNAMVLLTNQDSKDLQGGLQSYLERLVRQLTVCSLEKRSLNDDQGEAFSLHRALNSNYNAKS